MNPKRHLRSLTLLIIGSLLLCIPPSLWQASTTTLSPLPSFHDIQTAHRPSDKRLLDRSAAVIHELRTDMQRRLLAWTPLAEISPALQTAVLAAEDRRFYQHDGVDYAALLAAATQRITGGPRRGASTISMQLASMIEPHQPSPGSKTFRQKWNQIQQAWALERSWSKPEILETYLNLVSFRGELQGVAAAASVLFRKSPHGLTQAEATVLAVLLRSPNADRNLVTRRAQALQETLGTQNAQGELTVAVTQVLDAPHGFGPRIALAPHVAQRLLRSTETATTVGSTLDSPSQQAVTNILRRHILAVQERNVQDGAVLVVENATGNVLAYVGNTGDLSSARYVDGVQARRQAGSTLKPFLYGLGFDQRLLTPASVLKDLPLNVPVVGGLYRPQNYDEVFTGLVTVRTALAASLNIPAVRALELIGADVFVQQLRRLGFTGITQPGDYYGPSLALGSADISLWELVNAYRTLANAGMWSPLQIQTDDAVPTADQRLYSAATAFLIADILSDRERRSSTFGLHNALATRFWSAVKTGTSKEMRDNWCVGLSRDYTVGVWVGNFSGKPMWNVSGITGAAPVWQEVMSWLHRTQPSPAPEPPSGVLSQNVSFPNQIEPDRTEWFLSGTEPGEMSHGLTPGMTRILSPVHGTIVALDPDIPMVRQRIVFEAEANHSDSFWVLDGKKFALATQPQLWTPISGKHILSLVDTDDSPLDTIRFEVRGTTKQ